MTTIPGIRLPAEIEPILAEKLPYPDPESPQGQRFTELFSGWWLNLIEAQKLGITFVEILSVMPAPYLKKLIDIWAEREAESRAGRLI